MKLNCDLGEGLDATDARIIPLIDMANIACGGHAGDDSTMRRTITLCLQHHVAIGAHPSYPDKSNFGRRSLDIPLPSVRASVTEQIHRLQQHCNILGTHVSFIKPHGALYHDISRRPEIFSLMTEIILNNCPDLPLILFASSQQAELQDLAAKAGIPVLFEGFADRTYNDNGNLVPRKFENAVISDIAQIAAQALSIKQHHCVITASGKKIPVNADTICVHSDTPHAESAILKIKNLFNH